MKQRLYTPKKDIKQVVIELAKIIDSIFPDNSKQHITIQDLLIEMEKWGTPEFEPTPKPKVWRGSVGGAIRLTPKPKVKGKK